MAYDLVISKNFGTDEKPKYVGFISPEDYSCLHTLADRTKYNFFLRLLDPYKDEKFGLQDLVQAQGQLNELMLSELDYDERNVVYKLAAIVAFAIAKDENLYGVAD